MQDRTVELVFYSALMFVIGVYATTVGFLSLVKKKDVDPLRHLFRKMWQNALTKRDYKKVIARQERFYRLTAFLYLFAGVFTTFITIQILLDYIL